MAKREFVILAKSPRGEALIAETFKRAYFSDFAAYDEIKCNRDDPFLVKCIRALIDANVEYKQTLRICQIPRAYLQTWSIATREGCEEIVYPE